MTAITEDEKKIIKSVVTFDDLFKIKSELATVTSLKVENENLATAFIITNMIYICSVLGIELNKAQEMDMIDELGQVGWLTMADFKLFLDRMKKHKFYRRDYQELIVEFWKYADERLERAFNIEASKVDANDYHQRTSETLNIKQINENNPGR